MNTELQLSETELIMPEVDDLFSLSFEDIMTAEEEDPGRLTLASVVDFCASKASTDIHIKAGDPCRVRVSGKLVPAFISGDGQPIIITKEVFESMRDTMKFEARVSANRVYRFGNKQVRVQYFAHALGEHLTMRIQPLYAPSLVQILGEGNPLLESLKDASGLVLITGPIGSGKTTLAAALAQYWASAGRHVFTMEDPIEYLLQSDNGLLTQVNTNLTDNSITSPEITPFDDAVTTALRSDIDGMFFGEIRTAKTLIKSLEFAAAREPVVATFHAGGIADGLVRAMSMGTRELGGETAKLAISQAIHTVIYTDLAFDENDKPVSVVVAMPFNEPKAKKLIASFAPLTLSREIEDYLKEGSSALGYVNRDLASQFAISLGAIPELVDTALPPELQMLDY